MGFMDKAKKQLSDVVDQHGDKIARGADKVGNAINDRTGGKHADKIAKGKEQLRKGMDSLDDRRGDGPAGPHGTGTPGGPTPPPAT